LKLGAELINFLGSDHTILIRFWKGIGIVRRNLFWLSDEQWKRIEPCLPTDVRGVERVDDRRVISGIVHVVKSGCRWCDCPKFLESCSGSGDCFPWADISVEHMWRA